MKRWLLGIGVLFLLLSCASFPEPESQGNSLVIGTFVMDFPDGFFQEPPRKFRSDVVINFANEMTKEKFSLSTSHPGYFYFLSNGTDDYVFESFELKVESGSYWWDMHKTELKKRIITSPDKVIYLGNIVVSYRRPKKKLEGASMTSWHFEQSISTAWDRDALTKYIRAKKKDSRWLTCAILEYDLQQMKVRE